MSARVFIRLGIAAVVLAAAAYAVTVWLRPVAPVAPVVRGKAVKPVPATLTVLAETRDVRSELAGRVAESHLELGKAVTAGDLLIQLDTVALEIEIEQIKTDVAAARERKRIGPPSVVELDSARALLAYREEQEKKGLEMRANVDAQRRAIQQLEMRIALETVDLDQRLAALENSLKLKQDQLARMSLRSPIDGVISRIYAGRGDLIGGGSAVAEVIAHEREVEASISEEYFAGVAVGQRALIRFLGLGEEKFWGKVAKVLPASDPRTQRYLVRFEVEIKPGRLAPGITGDAMIVLAERDNAMIIPRPALIGTAGNAGGDYRVFVVEAGRVAVRKVTPGFIGLNDVEVIEGLRDGELVIADLLDRFREGQRVRVRTLGSGDQRFGWE